jgi:hypothetical protein
VTSPADATYAQIRVRGSAATSSDPYFWGTRIFFAQALSGQTELSPWSDGPRTGAFSELSQITTSNVTTYIANAAIGNAQIGGDIWSSNFVAGSAGWRIYRSGSAEFRNVTVRGDVEATSIKADAANIVNTLNVAGNAITTPLAGSIAELTVNQTVTNTYTYSRTLGTITTSSQGRGQVLILITPYKDEPLARAFTASDYPDALVATRITRNGITIFETTDSGDAASTNLSGAAYLDTPGAGVACTYAVVTYTYRGSGSTQFSQSHRIAQASFFIMEFKK